MADAKVEQTEKRKPRVTTGLGALDTMLGGLPNGIVILLVGEPGSGYEIFAQQILHAQASTGGSKVAYLTVEKPPDDIQSDMTVRNWEVDGLIGNGSWSFLDGFTPRVNVSKGNAGPKAILDLLTNNLLNSVKEDRWTAIDTVSYFLANYEIKDVISVLDDLILQARERGGLHFLLAVPNLQDDRTLASMS
ncbi:MAG: RAD55 family ATPase, partial [Nitrososphaerales archaeon]